MQGQALQKLEGFRLTTLYSKQMSASYNEGKMNVIMVDPVFSFQDVETRKRLYWYIVSTETKEGDDVLVVRESIVPKPLPYEAIHEESGEISIQASSFRIETGDVKDVAFRTVGDENLQFIHGISITSEQTKVEIQALAGGLVEVEIHMERLVA